MRAILFFLLSFLVACNARQSQNVRTYRGDVAFPTFGGALAQAGFAPLPLGTIKPRGWLRDQLEIQAAGLSGNIEDVWKDLGPSNAWKGGNGDAWERGPYYLDGLVPLAFLLDDKELLARMQVWIDWTLTHQAPDGAFAPRSSGDWWPDMVFLKALTQYSEASGDERVGPFLERYLGHLSTQLPRKPLDGWKKRQRYDDQVNGSEDLVGESDRWQYYRWTELVLSLLWQYRRHPSPELLALSKDLMAQGYDWQGYFKAFPYKQKSTRQQVFLANHGVNNAMGLKAPALRRFLQGAKASSAEAAAPLAMLNRWHGQANGSFGADEQLAGLDPSQGTELCTVVEQMYSLESMLWLTGDPGLGDNLERLAFNALPATLSEDCWRHQYDQQVNQVEVSEMPRAWTNNGPRANLFGLEPEWGCCTANFHQGWPKFAASLWMASSDGGLAAMSLAPAHLELRLPSGNRCTVEVLGNYPFDGKVEIKLGLEREEEFPLRLRIPAWAKNGVIKAGEDKRSAVSGSFLVLKRRWHDGESVEVDLPMPVQVKEWGDGTIIDRGPLLLALDIETREQARGKEKWSDRELFALQAWNVAPSFKPGAEIPGSMIELGQPQKQVFDRQHPPFRLRIPAKLVGNWYKEQGSAGPIPKVPQLEGPEQTITLIPYGAAKLRIGVFPRVK